MSYRCAHPVQHTHVFMSVVWAWQATLTTASPFIEASHQTQYADRCSLKIWHHGNIISRQCSPVSLLPFLTKFCKIGIACTFHPNELLRPRSRLISMTQSASQSKWRKTDLGTQTLRAALQVTWTWWSASYVIEPDISADVFSFTHSRYRHTADCTG